MFLIIHGEVAMASLIAGGIKKGLKPWKYDCHEMGLCSYVRSQRTKIGCTEVMVDVSVLEDYFTSKPPKLLLFLFSLVDA